MKQTKLSFRHIPLLLIAFFSLRAFANPQSDICGHWVSQNSIWGQGVEFQLSFDFTENQTALTVDCYFQDGAALRSSATSFANYYQNQIYIQQSQQNVSNDGYHFCRATLAPSTWNIYFTADGRMTLLMPVPYQSQLRLVRTY